jgi:hypothetical protein
VAQAQANKLAASAGTDADYMAARGATPVSTLGTTPAPKPAAAPAAAAPAPLGGYDATATGTAQTAATAAAQDQMQKQLAVAPGGKDYVAPTDYNKAVEGKVAATNAEATPAEPAAPPDPTKGEGEMPNVLTDSKNFVAWNAARDKANIAAQNRKPEMFQASPQFRNPGMLDKANQPSLLAQNQGTNQGMSDMAKIAADGSAKANAFQYDAMVKQLQLQNGGRALPPEVEQALKTLNSHFGEINSLTPENSIQQPPGTHGGVPAAPELPARNPADFTPAAPSVVPKPSAPATPTVRQPKAAAVDAVDDQFKGRTTSMQRRGAGVGKPAAPPKPKAQTSTSAAKEFVSQLGGG